MIRNIYMKNGLILVLTAGFLAACSSAAPDDSAGADDVKTNAAIAPDSGNPDAETSTSAEADGAFVDADGVSLCPDDGPKLPGTGICVGQAPNYMNIVGGDAPSIPENCQWTANETAFASDYLLYMAATCDGKKAQLEFSGGAHFSDLTLAWSAVSNGPMNDTVLIRATGADMANPHQNVLYHARESIESAAEAAECSVHPAGRDGWPEDALVVDISSEKAALEAKDGPRWACGPFGLNEDETAYWRVFQGFSWWFQFSQDAYQDVDPRTLTLLVSDGDGGWMTAE